MRVVPAGVAAVARRSILAAACLSAMTTTTVPSFAIEPFTVASGTIALQRGLTKPPDAAAAALYITARTEAAPGSKIPPLARARVGTDLSFPYRFRLTTSDLTPEYASVDPQNWEAADLIITARFDTDGVAATRGPDDLVGRAPLLKHNTRDEADWSKCAVELQGRGLTGLLLTGGSK
jgi:hypothetical protein